MTSPLERRRITKAQKEADPTTYSALTPRDLKRAGMVQVYEGETGEKVERSIYEDTHGNRYYEITQVPQTQQFVARMLKGIFNVADVIRVTDGSKLEPDFFVSEYASKEFNLSKDVAPATQAEINADEFLFAYVLYDVDHGFYPSRQERHAATDLADPKEGGNVRYRDNKGYHFDFAATYERFFAEPGVFMTGVLERILNGLSPEALEIAARKLDALSARFSGSSGKAFLRRVMRSTGKDIPELFQMNPSFMPRSSYDDPRMKPFDRFYRILMSRIRKAKQVIKIALRSS